MEVNSFNKLGTKLLNIYHFFPFITSTGGNFVTMEKHTSDALDSQLTAEGVCGVLTWVPSEYEEPVRSAPQYEMV